MIRKEFAMKPTNFRNHASLLRWMSGLMLLAILVGAVAGCRVTAPTAAPETPPPTQAPTNTPVPTPTPTPLVGLAEVVDDGSPLAPQVIAQSPGLGQEAALDAAIEVTFDQPMDTDATASALSVTDLQGKAVPGEVTWVDETTLRFAPAQPLDSGATYLTTLSTGAASKKGVALREPVSFDFTTVGELRVSQVFPADQAEEIEGGAVITVIFNRPVAPLVTSVDQGSLPQPLTIEPPVAGQGEWVNTSVYAFTPDEPLAGGVEYTVLIPSGLADATGDSMLAEEYRWSFTTHAPAIGYLELSNGWINPDTDYADFLLDDYFKISFLQSMDRGSTEAALSLVSDNGEKVPLRTEWNDPSGFVIITPTQRLALGTTYTLILSAEAQAATGGGLDEGLVWRFTTVPYPAIRSTYPADGATQPNFDNTFWIYFTSPMDMDSLEGKVIFTPELEKSDWWYNDWGWSMYINGLKPSTSYEVQILPGMTDIYGNPVTEGRTIRFKTAGMHPMARLQMPYNRSLFRADGPQEFFAAYRNVNRVDLKLYHLPLQTQFDMLTGSVSWPYRPPEENLVWQSSQRGSTVSNQTNIKAFYPTQGNGDPLAPGFYFLTLNSPNLKTDNPYWDDRTFVVATANLTFKTTATQALVWLTDLTTGQPIAGVPVTIYDGRLQPIGEGVTGADGSLYLDVPAPEQSYGSRYALADGNGHFAFATSDDGSGVSPYDFGIWGDYYYYMAPNQPTAYVYTERPIYRPGQPVYFKGIVRLDDDLAYSLPTEPQVRVVIQNYDEAVYEETLPLSGFGSFAGEFTLDTEATLGYYYISVYLDTGKEDEYSIGSVSFNVAEYRKPEYQVEVGATPTDVLGGQNFEATIDASYYSGGALVNADVYWTLVAEPYNFYPGGDFSQFSFTDFDYDDYENYDVWWGASELIADGNAQTDENGRLTLSLPVDLSESKTSRRLTFEATVTDLSGTAVSGRATVIAHRSAVYAGVRSLQYVGVAGKPQTFELAAVDWDGQPVAGQSLQVEIVERRWNSVQEQDPTGRVQWTWSVEEIPVESFEGIVTDEQGLATVTFTPLNGGIFKARVTTLDADGNEARASAFMWVAGPNYIPWRMTNDRSFELIADRDLYAPGDTAEILIASPFQGESWALVTVERGRIRTHEVVRLTSNSTIYPLPVTSDLAPNAYVSVLIIKGVDDTNLKPDFRMSMVELKVDTRLQELNVTVTPDKPQASPGETVTYQVQVTDRDGQPASAEVSLSLSDLATLSLMEPNSAPILSYFYSQRGLNVRTAVPIVNSIEDYNVNIEETVEEGEAMGAGGGGEKGAFDVFGVVEIRQNFPDTAFWEAFVTTDANGDATISVTLPDNLTTWRMEAKAVTFDTRVGQTTVDIVSTKPLLLRPQTPRFFVVGDEAILGAAVHNNTDQPLSVSVSLQAEGVTLGSEAAQQVEIEAHRQAYLTWNISVNLDASRVDLVFLADGGEYSDATRPTLGTLDNQGIPVYRYEVPETVGASGQMLEGGTIIEAISLPKAFTVSEGNLTVKVSPSLAAGMTDSLTYLEHYPYECVEQTVSKFLPNVITSRALREAGLSDSELEAKLETQVSTALQRLYHWQNPDGGWGWWGDQKSDTLTTAYVVLALSESIDAGYSVDDNVYADGIKFLRGQINSLRSRDEPYKLNRQAFLLYVLARADRLSEVSKAVQLYEQRANLALYAKAYLAHTLYLIDPQDTRIQTLLSDFNTAAILSATGTHWEEETRDYWNWNTDTRTTAIVLSAVSVIDPENPLNANAVRWLMSHRTDGHWLGTQETAWTLMALTNWMVASGELQADYQYGIALNGERIGGGIANAETLRQTYELVISVADLLTDEANRLAIARDAGAGNLYYTAHLNATLPVEQVGALNQGIIVSRSYYRLDDRQTPVAEATQGELLLVRLTVVAPNALHYVMVDDPLPAGLEAVDQSLLVSPQEPDPSDYNWKDFIYHGWGWWYFSHIERRDERVVLSADYLPAGTYVFSYLVRASTPGAFRVIPPTAQEFYFPEVYGRGEGSLFTVAP
jgi:hypothetical protein